MTSESPLASENFTKLVNVVCDCRTLLAELRDIAAGMAAATVEDPTSDGESTEEDEELIAQFGKPVPLQHHFGTRTSSLRNSGLMPPIPSLIPLKRTQTSSPSDGQETTPTKYKRLGLQGERMSLETTTSGGTNTNA